MTLLEGSQNDYDFFAVNRGHGLINRMKLRLLLENSKLAESSTARLICRAGRTLSALWRWQPLGFRGASVLAASVAAFSYYALPEKDLSAQILALSMALLVAATAIVGFIFRLILGLKLRASVWFTAHNPLARMPIETVLEVEGSAIWPFYELRFRRALAQNGLKLRDLLASGREPLSGKRIFRDFTVFPHRGLWTMENIVCSIEDKFGFTHYSWLIPCSVAVQVSAPNLSTAEVPIIPASIHPGDEIFSTHERTGDLYDTKPYDPSDGVKRILWKTYARSNELISRRPELAASPEGKVALYLVANREEDAVAGAAQQYIDLLGTLNVSVLFGTDGLSDPASIRVRRMSQQASTLQTSRIFSDRAEIQLSIDSTVWSKNAGTGRDFSIFLAELSRQQRGIEQVIVFGPKRGGWVDNLRAPAQDHSLQLHLVLVDCQKGLRVGRRKHKAEELANFEAGSNSQIYLCATTSEKNSPVPVGLG